MQNQKSVLLSSALTALLICTFFQDGIARAPQKILKGSDASITDFPAMVSIQYNLVHRCGGVLISNKHVLTAAHCVSSSEAKYYRVLTGRDVLPDGIFLDSSRVEKIDVHPGYDGEKYLNDIAIFTLKNSIELSETQKPINLPSEDTTTGVVGEIVGWGAVIKGEDSINQLKHTKMTTVDSKMCQKSQICAFQGKGIGICDGDSGGPFIVNNEVAGIISWSISCGFGQPEGYTRVYYFKDWINSIIVA